MTTIRILFRVATPAGSRIVECLEYDPTAAAGRYGLPASAAEHVSRDDLIWAWYERGPWSDDGRTREWAYHHMGQRA